MQISLKWINELVDIERVSLEELIEKLTLGGFEVEEIIEIEINQEKLTALEISTTANRSDSLSIQGIAIEIAALFNQKLKTSTYRNRNFDWSSKMKQFSPYNLLTKDCLEFRAVTVQNLTDFSSPKWLQDKLIASGIVPENTLVDFQNYILLEKGYPIEVYDFEKICQKLNSRNFNFHLTSAKINQEFLANNQINYPLNNSILILQAKDLPISIAGIIPNQNYEYSKTTKSLLIEGSIFNAATIRQQSRRLGLRTLRSSRYEKSLTTTNLFDTLYQFVGLLRIFNPNLICKLHTSTSFLEQKRKIIKLHYHQINQILGPIQNDSFLTNQYISPQTITTALERFQFEVKYHEESRSWIVQVPDFRSNDIEREIDLIEEIGRWYGFNNFLTRLPSLQKIGTEDLSYKLRKKLTVSLLSSGFNELIQYSLVSENTYMPNRISLINPLVKEYANLRSSLLPSLLKAVEENTKKSNLVLEGFEYGHVFSTSSFERIQEEEYIAGIFGGFSSKSDWSNHGQFLTWFEGKAKLDEIVKKLNLVTYWQAYKPVKEKNILHPYRSAELYLVDQSKLGVFGQIHPLLAKQLNISTKIYLFEWNFEIMKEQIQKNKLLVYQEYSSYPKIIKDLSFIISQSISFQELKETLFLNGSKFLTEINLLDVYHGTSIPSGKISLCVQFIFQSNTQTLKNKKIEKILEHLKSILMTQFKSVIRV